VLIVEDDPLADELLSQYLSDAGYALLHAANRQNGLSLARLHKPDAITLDILLPEAEDGWGLLADLKSDSETEDIPVVVVSITDDQQQGFSMGAVDWFVKPVQRQGLITALDDFMDNGRPIRVLVVDDEPTVLELLGEILETRGHRVISALGGQQGIDLAIANNPDVIILDLLMPEVNGFEVVHQLRARSETAQTPILIFTASELTPAEREQLNRHVQSITLKTEFGQKELQEALARVLDK
jgi:CheY-like chemotaxis protein